MANRPSTSGKSTSKSTAPGKAAPGAKVTRSGAFEPAPGETTWGPSRRSRAKPTAPTRGDQARTEVKEAIDDRRSEYIGLGLIVGGVLSALAVYFKLAGPLGRGVSDLLGWLTGQGRYLIPIALIAVGVAMIRKGEIRQRFRLALGILLIAAAFLGLEHITRGSDNLGWSLSALQRAGGWLGALIAEPLQSLIAPAGATVLLIAAALFGVLLITRKPLREAVGSIIGWTKAAAKPVGAVARKAVGDVSTLSSERESGPIPLYDVDSEDSGGAPRPAAPSSPRKRLAPGSALPPPTVYDDAPAAQAELPLAPGAQKGEWKLPPASYLVTTGAQAINKAE